MNNKMFERPEIELIEVDTKDVLTDSIGNGENPGYEEDPFENLLK